MQSIIWAIGTTVVLMLIISLLPIGYTLKGKFLIILTSFILSLGGLGAVATFPLWETALILFALVFFVAYFMNNRMGTLLYKESPVLDSLVDEESVDNEYVHVIDKLEDDNLVEIGESQLLTISESKEPMDSKPEILEEDSFLLEKNTVVEVFEQKDETNLEHGYLAEIESLLEFEEKENNEEKIKIVEEDVLEEIHDLPTIMVEENIAITNESELNDEDLSFLFDRDTDVEVIEQREELNLDNGYLAEIESLLEFEEKDEVEAKTGTLDEDDVLEEITVLPTIVAEEKASVPIADEDYLDDTLFDFLLAKKEAAVDREELLEETETKKKVSMQK